MGKGRGRGEALVRGLRDAQEAEHHEDADHRRRPKGVAGVRARVQAG